MRHTHTYIVNLLKKRYSWWVRLVTWEVGAFARHDLRDAHLFEVLHLTAEAMRQPRAATTPLIIHGRHVLPEVEALREHAAPDHEDTVEIEYCRQPM